MDITIHGTRKRFSRSRRSSSSSPEATGSTITLLSRYQIKKLMHTVWACLTSKMLSTETLRDVVVPLRQIIKGLENFGSLIW